MNCYILQNINNLVASETDSLLSHICQIGNFVALQENIICTWKSLFYGEDMAILLGHVGTGSNRAFVPVYIEKVEIWSGVTDVLLTHRLQNSATQFV